MIGTDIPWSRVEAGFFKVDNFSALATVDNGPGRYYAACAVAVA